MFRICIQLHSSADIADYWHFGGGFGTGFVGFAAVYILEVDLI